MTQQEKQLLLKDLCARLPYGVKVKYFDMEYPFGSKPVILTPYLLYNRWENIQDVKPYLRPMPSMTEEESKELYAIRKSTQMTYSLEPKELDWLNAHHFDYRGLIDRGLALEALPGMYKTE